MMKIPALSKGLNGLGLAALTLGMAGLGLAGTAGTAEACDPESYIGSICWIAAEHCPEGTLEADGHSELPLTHSKLHDVIGDAYTVNAGTHDIGKYKRPDLVGDEVVGAGQVWGHFTIDRGETGHPASIEIGIAQLPTHSHDIDLSQATSTATLRATSLDGDAITPEGALFAKAQTEAYASTADTTLADGMINETVEYAAFETGAAPESATTKVSMIPPQLGMRACIVYDRDDPEDN